MYIWPAKVQFETDRLASPCPAMARMALPSTVWVSRPLPSKSQHENETFPKPRMSNARAFARLKSILSNATSTSAFSETTSRS